MDSDQNLDWLEAHVAEAYGDEIVALRRHLHRHPELGFDTERTAASVLEALAGLPLEVHTGVAKNGVVATLRGGAGDGPTVGLRADMDALPVHEETGLPFASEVEGKMHACGHDGHTSMLVGAAQALSEVRDTLNGTVKFFFQPAEEGGRGGARVMLEEGVGDDVSCIFALHLWPHLPFGTVATRGGAMMAASDNFELRIKGSGGHGAMPHLAVDAVVMAIQVVSALQTVISREVDPAEPAVLTVGKIDAGTAFNVIPEGAEIVGTVRTLDPDLRQTLPRRIEELAQGVARGMRGDAELDYNLGYPVTRNDPETAARAFKVADNLFGSGSVIEAAKPSMGAEDFAFFLEKLPGAYIWLGTRDEEHTAPLHNPAFGFDERILPKGAALLAALALESLT
jgi:hippurate hydrolase